MANTNATLQQAAHTTYQLSSPSCSTKAISKSLTLNEKCKFSERTISRKMTSQKEQEDQAEKARGEIRKVNQTAAPCFQTGEHHTSPASLVNRGSKIKGLNKRKCHSKEPQMNGRFIPLEHVTAPKTMQEKYCARKGNHLYIFSQCPFLTLQRNRNKIIFT